MTNQTDANRSLQAALDHLKVRIPSPPTIALILGSGLGDFANELHKPLTIDSADIPNYPQSSVQGHSGRLVFGTFSSGKRRSPPLLIFQGRIHFYERGELPPVTFPVQLAQLLGATILIATNAAGGIKRSFKPGDFMLLDDFLSLTFLRESALPLSQTSRDTINRPAFAHPFDTRLQRAFQSAAEGLGLELKNGVYCWLKGPAYETAAEIEMLRRVGADAVGMSTVPEIVAAHRLGMRIAAISLISNMATGIATEKLSHSEVTETAERIKPAFTALMKEVLLQIGEDLQPK